ncbi:MAG: nucleotidyltransferase family protein [Anaerolineae bacterium]|nr:nucleotidyltransferase family protein [Anaerolineae bacterium]
MLTVENHFTTSIVGLHSTMMFNSKELRKADEMARRLCRIISQPHEAHTIHSIDWPVLGRFAEKQGLGPMLYYTLSQLELDSKIDAATWTFLEQSVRRMALLHTLFEREQDQIAQMLEDAGVRFLWLKGLSVAKLVYPESYLRPLVDLDLLVPESQLDTAMGGLLAFGYQIQADESETLLGANRTIMRKLTHHVVMRRTSEPAITVELHYRVGNYLAVKQHVDPTQWVWEHTVPNDDGTLVLTLEALLLYLCAHIALQHGDQAAELKLFLDVHLLITTKQLDWHIIVSQAIYLRWTMAVEHVLRRTSNMFGTHFPVDVIDTLREQRTSDENESRFASLQNPGAILVNIEDMLRQLSMRERLWLIGRILVPSPNYMRNRYQIAPGRSVNPYYGLRWWQQTLQVGEWAYNWLRNRHQPDT